MLVTTFHDTNNCENGFKVCLIFSFKLILCRSIPRNNQNFDWKLSKSVRLLAISNKKGQEALRHPCHTLPVIENTNKNNLSLIETQVV